MTDDTRVATGRTDRATIRQLLETEYDRLVELRRAVGGDVLEEIDSAGRELSQVGHHPADSGTEPGDLERDQALLERLDRQLRDVDDALGRLDRGEYGRCEVCGRSIGEARLEALPATRFCLTHSGLGGREAGGAPATGGGAVTPL